ncbi:abnormal spindle-like microcephaly-associated protein homolog isoform X2 [Stigmatopora nigra]
MSGTLLTSSGQRGFMDFSPTKTGDTDKENVPVLTLDLFSKAPFVSFGTVKIGTSKSTILRIENPTSETEAVVTVDRIPSSKGLSVDNNTFTIQPLDSFSLTLRWTPTEEGGIRELVIFNANGFLKHQAVLLGRAEAPKKKKKSLWDAIKHKKEGEKGFPYRAKKTVPLTKMTASKTVDVSQKQQYKHGKAPSPHFSLNDGKTGRDKSVIEHCLLVGKPLKSEQQRSLKPIQRCFVEQENVLHRQRHLPLLLGTNETEPRGSSGSFPGTVDNKKLSKMLDETLSPIGTPEKLKTIMPQTQPGEQTACSCLNTVHGPVVSLNDALALINSDLSLINSGLKSSSPSCDLSDSLEFKSEDHDQFQASYDSLDLSESTESRLTFFVKKNVGVPKVEKPLEKPKKINFNCETVIKNKAPVTTLESVKKIKKSRRRLLENTLELSESSSQSEHGPAGTPTLPVIETDTRTKGSDSTADIQEFIDRPMLRLDDVQMHINTHLNSPPSSPHCNVSTSSPPQSAPATFTISSLLPLGQSCPLPFSNKSYHNLPEPSQSADNSHQLVSGKISTQENLFPVHLVTESRKRKSDQYLRDVQIDNGKKMRSVKRNKMVSWKTENIESSAERNSSQRQPVKLNGPVSARSTKAQRVKCVKMVAVAMPKLTFAKPTQAAIPRHPLPFAAKNMFYDERWIEKQERGFTWWLNYILTPDDFKVKTESTKVNAAPLTMVYGENFNVSKAPTKEEMSFSTYTARRKLNRLRRAACQIFTSEAMVKAIKRLELEVEAKRLHIRKDRHLWKDIGEREKVLNWLLSYNPLWLRIGLETIFGELISLESNSDSKGLAMFILQRLLWNPDIAAEFRHPKVPHLYKDGHEEALTSFTLKKLLLLVCFLDKAKVSRLIEHDPCLFCVDGEFKTSKDLLLALSRDFLSGEGILPRHLGYLGLSVSHVQTPLDEFDFAVMNLAVDLKCGIRLVRVVELLIKQWDFSAKLRLPAISRLQKIHNIDIALQVLKNRGIDLKDEHGSIIDSRDIVDGHREKTLSLLWKIIFSFQVEVILDEDHLREEIIFLKKTLRTKQKLARVRAGHGFETSGVKPKFLYEHGSTKVVLLMEWARAVCDFYNLTLENFTVTFSDGRVLCYLIHHYHPSLIPEESIRHNTTQTVDCSSGGRMELNCSATDSDNSFDYSHSGLNGPEFPTVKFVELLENETSNFSLVNSAVALLGGVPAMINPADMSNTIPDEKVVMSYLSFLCARLLDLRNETRAARVIQAVWRNYRFKKDLQCYQERNVAAAKIQVPVRLFLHRCRGKKQSTASTIIQSVWRGFVTRKKLRMMKEKELCIIRYRATTIIQAAYRGYCVRREINKQNGAASLIQSYWRCSVQKRIFQKKRQAAVKLQQRFRAMQFGKVERKTFLRKRQAIITLQSYFRVWILRKEHEAATVKRRLNFAGAVFHHLCAIKIQRALRTYWTLKTAKTQIHSVIIIQNFVRMMLQKRRYQADRRKVVTAQRAVRRWLVRRHNSALVIQAATRNFLLLRRQKKVQQGIVKAQAAYRGYCVRREINKQNGAASLIQSYWRCSVQKRIFQKKRQAAVKLQQRFRAMQFGKVERKTFLRKRQAIITLQSYFRVWILRKEHEAATVKRRLNFAGAVFHHLCAIKIQRALRTYWTLKTAKTQIHSVIIIQNFVRMMLQKRRYQADRRKVVTAQRAVRRWLVRRHNSALVIQAATRNFLLLRRQKKVQQGIVKAQAAYRGYCVRREINKQNGAASLIQSYWRCSVQKRIFQKKRQAAVKLQQRFRAMQFGKVERKTFLRKRQAIITLQSYFRVWILRKEHEAATVKRRLNFAGAVFHHLCAIKIQRALRTYWTLKTAKTQIHSVIIIQNFVRMMLQKRRYQADRRKVVTAQRAVRRWLVRRHNSALVIQAATRNFLLLRRQKKVQQGIVKAQALWRGHVSRQRNDNMKVIKLRHKLRKVSAGAQEEDKLHNKTSSALDCILRYKHFSSILEALKTLEATTRLSSICCEKMVDSGATSTIFTLILSCNRSVPCMDVITYSIQILLNLSKYHKTIEAVYAVENSVNTLVDLLQTYRGKAGDKVADKGKDIFTTTCLLLILLLQNRDHAKEAMKCPKILDKIKCIYKLTVRKHNMDSERNVTKQKMKATINGSFSVPATPHKCHLDQKFSSDCVLTLRKHKMDTQRNVTKHKMNVSICGRLCVPATPQKCHSIQKFAPDWVLRKDKLKNIVDPLEAIQMLADALLLVM